MRRLLFAAALLSPVAAHAQALRCQATGDVGAIHPELPTTDQPMRVVPIGGYTLAVSWAPEYCQAHARDPQARFECGGGNRFGFALHGLWPDGEGKQWPQYCRATPLLPAAVVRANLCATPSAQLLQHEWAKHGTCMPGETPASYFRRSTTLYRALRWPDMAALSRRPLTAGQLAAAMARQNPGLPAAAVRVTTNAKGWLDELWLCLDRGFRYRRCVAGSGGVAADTPVKVWRGPR